MNEENKNLLDEITGLRQPKTSALNIRNAVKMDPEQAARDIELATKTTLPLDTVQRNRDELQQREYVNSVGNLEGFPAVERFMSDQRNAAVAVDDIENLKLTEKAIQDDIGIWSTFDNWAGGTLNRVNTLTGNFIELVGNMGDEIRDVFDTLGIPNPGIVIGEDGMSFTRDIPRDMPSILTETGKAVSEGQGYDYVPQFTWERLKGDISVRNLSGYVAEQGIQSLPDMVAAMFTLPAYIASRTEEIAEERVANDERKDVELADLGKSLVPALGVSLIERLGAKVTFGKGGVSSPLDALKATGGAAAIEGGTEFVQEGIEYLGETLGTQKEFDTGEMFDRQLAGLVAGSGMGGAIRGTTSTIEALASRTSRRVETNLESLGEQQLIDKIVEYSQSSRLRGRMADRYADFLRGTNSPREVFVTTDGIEAVKQLGVELPQSLTRQDNDLGLDTTMDIATFATEIAGNPELMEVLRPHVRLSSESLSLNEMEQHDLELEKMVERAEQSKELKAEADRIYDEVKDQIVATGRQSEATARYSARIIPAYVTTKAEALGLTPAEVYERMGLKVTGPATELREGQTLEQSVPDIDRWDMFDYVTGSNDKTYAELMELTKPLIDVDERLWSIDVLPEYFDTSLLDGIENPSMVYSNSKLLSHIMTESGQVYRVIHSKNEVAPLTEEESQNFTVNTISGIFRDVRNNSPEEHAKQAEQRARLEEERRRDRRIQDAPKLSGDFNADLKTLADYAENFEEFKRLLSADMLDISDRNRTRLARALIALDPDAERASTIMEQQPDMVEDAQRYGTPSEKAAANALNSKSKRVTIFRTMPSGAAIEAGDWVALVKSYAQSHSGNVTEGKATTRQKTISKDDLYWYGADFNEWVYVPSDTWGNYTSLEDVWQDLAGDKPRTYNQFAGMFSATAPTEQLQRAVAMEDSDVSMATIRRETGWFKGTDNRWRYEISDDKAEFKTDITDEMRDKYRDRVEREADVSERAGGLYIAEMQIDGKYVTGQGRSADAAKKALIDELLRRDGDVLLGGIRGIRGLGGINGTTVGQILNHPELFEAYPFIRDVRVSAIENPESGEFGAFYPDERRIELNTNRTDAELLSTLLHEIQHVIQNEEDFAGGGNMSTEFAKAVKDAVAQMTEGSQRAVERWMERNDAKMDDAARAAELAQNALMYKSVVKLMEYANHDKPSSVFRHVRNHVQWIYERSIREDDQLRQRANEIERMFYDIPRRGPKRNAKIGEIAEKTAQLLSDTIPKADLRDFKEDERTLDAMVKALTRDANKAQQPLKPLRGLKREAAAAKVLADATKYKTPYQVYRSLAGEIEARTTQARQNLTPEERQARDPSLDMDTPRNEAIVVMGSLELKIPNVQSSVAPPRGSVTFTPNNEAIIRLGQASDLSTFIHESGHLFLEMEGKFAKEFGITEDQQTILDWLGVESFDDIQVEQHEQFARGFEAYTREGKAPSLALRDAFAAFRRWLLRIYRDIAQLNVNLTDDVRGVMDRMLATEREIEEALSAPNYEELFRSKEQAGMTDTEWEKYQKTLEKRLNAATQTIDEKLLKEYTRRKTQEWNEEKAQLVEQERERLSQLPVYQIMSDARQFPMDFDALKEQVGVEKLPGKFIGLAKKDGIDPQEYAETYGYNNVTQMYNAIVDAQPLKKAADEAAEAIMIQKYGDILNDGSIEAEVREAVHNEEQASLLMQELNALKPPRVQAINTQQIKLNARNTISKMKYGEIKPNKYNRAEIRAAQNAARATSKEEQYQYKLQQVVNHHLYREAIAAREAMIKQRKYIRGVQKREYSSKQIAPEYITNMKLIANMYDMRQKPAQTMAIEQVLAWYQTQMNDPNDFAQLQLLDVNLVRALAAQQAGELATFELPTFDDLTVEDLQSTYDMLRHLRHVGGQMSDVAKAEFQQEVDVLSASIEQHGGRDVKDRAGLPGKHTDLKRKLSHLINLIPSLRNLMRKLDGFIDGAAYDSIYTRIEEAQNKKLELGVEMYKRFESELKDIHKIGLSKKDHKTYITDDGMEIDITSEHRFMMALYWGTESSRDAIRDGWNLTDGDVSRILADMPDEQIDLLNAVWKVNESMWPELSAASTRLYGVAPPKLTPTPFSINGKQLSGGHMRLFYDSSELEMKSEQEDAAKMSTIVPSRAGSLYERVGSGGRAPLLDVNNMVRAIEDNVHFISFAEAGRTVAALMNNNGVKDVMERKHGRGFRKALVQNLENITSNRPAIETLPVIPQVSRLVRHALTMKYLAYSLRNAIQGIPSIKTAMDEVGFTPFMGAFTRFVSPSSHKETVSFVQERSAFMKNRSSVINREASEYLNKVKITGRAGHAWDLFRAYGFTPQTIIDSFIAYPAWIAKYEARIMEHGDEKRAASEADTAVAESVGSGSDLHLGAAMQQNNTEFVKTMTVFGSWFNNYYQRIYKSTEAFTDFRNRETLQALITTPFVIATLSALLIMDFPDADGEDDEQWMEWMIKRYTGFMAGTVPLLRDINSAFGGFTPKTPLSSVAELPKRLTDEIGAVAEDRQTPLKSVSDIINITTTIVPVPGAGNVTRVMNFVDSDMQGNETGSGFAKTYQALVEGPNRN